MKQVLVGMARQGCSVVKGDLESAVHIPPPTLFVSDAFNIC